MATAHIANFVNAIVAHEISEITGRNIALASSIESLKGSIGLESLSLAKVLSAELNSLLALACMGQQLSHLLLSHD